MRQTLFLLLLLPIARLLAYDSCWSEDHLSLEFDAGYRRDYFAWHIESDKDCLPSVLSDFTFKEIQSGQIAGYFRYENCYHYYFRANGDGAKIYSGIVHSHQYAGDDRCDPYQEMRATCDGGYHYDLSGGIGYTFYFLTQRVMLAPMLGYAINYQHFTMNNGFVEYALIPELLTPCSTLDDVGNFNTRWQGPWTGLDFRLRMTRYMWLEGNLEYHWNVHYHANGTWNFFSPPFNKFWHHAHGQGGLMTFNLQQQLSCDWFIGFTSSFYYFLADNGKVEFDEPCEPPIRLDLGNARWWGFNFMAHIAYYF